MDGAAPSRSSPEIEKSDSESGKSESQSNNGSLPLPVNAVEELSVERSVAGCVFDMVVVDLKWLALARIRRDKRSCKRAPGIPIYWTDGPYHPTVGGNNVPLCM